jgi:hypothetical protein
LSPETMVTTSPLLAMSRNGYDAHIRESLNHKWCLEFVTALCEHLH